MDKNELRELAFHAAHRTAPQNFSLKSVDQAFADGLKALVGGSINNFMRNRYDLFEILIEQIDDVVPQKVMGVMSQFAEIRQVAQGETVRFKRGIASGRNRAKKFLTQVGLSGVYESFRLDNEQFTIGMKSIGGAVSIDFERMLDGAESLAEFLDVLAEAQEDAIYGEVQDALISAASHMPIANKVVGNYSATAMQNLVNTVKAYGGGATIFASPEFIMAMGADVVTTPISYVRGATGGTSAIAAGAQVTLTQNADDLDSIHRTGKISLFRGTPIVELTQSFADDTNTKVLIHPQYAYVLPTGGEKVVKIVMEGQTQIYDGVNRDNSIEINTYRKIGVGILAFNNWGIYQNTDIDASNWEDTGVLDLDIDMHIEG